MTKASSVTGVDANGASPERRPPPTRQIVVVIERMSDRGRRREGEEEAGGWDEAWRTSSITKGGTHDDGADANGVSPNDDFLQHVGSLSSWRGEGGRKGMG